MPQKGRTSASAQRMCAGSTIGIGSRARRERINTPTPKGGKGKKRGHSEGALYYSETKGLWVGYPTRKRGQPRARPVYAKTRVKALAKLKEAQQKIDEGMPIESAHDTVENLLVDFLAKGLPSSKVKPANTKAVIRWAIDEHLVATLGTVKLRDLSADDVESMLTTKANEGMSSSSLKRIHGTLKRALRWGERRDRVSRNVAALVDTPAGTTRESKALTIEQGRALLAKAHHHRFEALFLVGLTIPTRPGELLGLCWDCVDFHNGVIHFSRALHRNSTTGELWLDELKTPQ